MHDQFRLINNNAQMAVHLILGVLFDPRLDSQSQLDFLKTMQFKSKLFTTTFTSKFQLNQVAKYLNPALLEIFESLHTLNMDSGSLVLLLAFLFFSTPKLGLREPGAILTIQLQMKKLLRSQLIKTHREANILMPIYNQIKLDLLELTKTKNSFAKSMRLSNSSE